MAVFLPHNPEPISGYTNVTEGNWYLSDNTVYDPAAGGVSDTAEASSAFPTSSLALISVSSSVAGVSPLPPLLSPPPSPLPAVPRAPDAPVGGVTVLPAPAAPTEPPAPTPAPAALPAQSQDQNVDGASTSTDSSDASNGSSTAENSFDPPPSQTTPQTLPDPPADVEITLDRPDLILTVSWSPPDSDDLSSDASSTPLTYEFNYSTSTALDDAAWQSVGEDLSVSISVTPIDPSYLFGVRAVDGTGETSTPVVQTWDLVRGPSF